MEISGRVSGSYNHPEGVAAAFIELIGSYADISLESLSSHRGTYNARDSGKQRGERLSDSVEKTWMHRPVMAG